MRVFLDAESGPWHPAAKAAFAHAVEDGWADPRGLHTEGRRAAEALAGAREQVAAVLQCRPDEVVFDSSGAAAARRAVTGLYIGRRRVSSTIVVSAVEHSSILQSATGLTMSDSHPAQMTTIAVDSDGLLDIPALQLSAAQEPALASIQAANLETGVVQPCEDVLLALTPPSVPWHVDATAALPFGTIPSGWAALTADARAWGGPAGVGVLAVRTNARWRNPDVISDSYEFGKVPGMPSVPAVVAAAAALVEVRESRQASARRLAALSQRIRNVASQTIPHVQVHSGESGCPHITSMSFLYVSGEALASELDSRGFAVASGSACANELHTPSHVLAAMGRLTEGNVRLTLTHDIDDASIDLFLAQLPDAVAAVREKFGATGL